MQTTCEICEVPAHGIHFGAITCRGCAAFFRRAVNTKTNRKSCKYSSNCTNFTGKFPQCKSCRMRKCIKMGMMPEKVKVMQPISQSLEIFVSRPNLILFTNNYDKTRNYIDVSNLITRGLEILKQGFPTPLGIGKTNLERMASGVEFSTAESKIVDVVTGKSVSMVWEFDFISTAKWLTRLQDFCTLPMRIQMQLLQTIWHVWSRMYKVVKSSELRKKHADSSNLFQVLDQFHVNLGTTKLDVSWLTTYSYEEIKYFLYGIDDDIYLQSAITAASKLELTDVELTYMAAQTCFQYAQNRFAGTEIAEVCAKFQEILANDLHTYYTKDHKRTSNYAGKLSQMLKCVQEIQKSIRTTRERTTIARTFDIYITDFSNPEMFIDSGC
ncbi:Nuclear hormone receptor family member nhr-106 [Caenorhabditis elegans]|uniref:Nuclear hormone receptor family member nhr-106 n=1 Tax=Caenorhabditis elegans TaxID=6239 RepID=NH106_CAEEL|nr:Nuclear hormone receptor family member nhr-106 [Caenorhabditis elegans]O16966.2 RecName: Full=Nuclear hormone receptor family member nhr-106 [Caenorhabditis elegans]AAO39194.1 nuclear receptor NHR-106 [Caenorhabditis elegans]CCD73119.1 Nuclear hormone receptor family member nhr-106 [Caenorhabditis elegans]|eukprot:NP_503219.1 Nuclear hormone receptor family member nhr-106 [Caenorhabditis elegans]